MKKLALLFFGLLSLSLFACGGAIVDLNDGGGGDGGGPDEGTDGYSLDAGPFLCGATECTEPNAVCVHSCCGGAIICAPREDGGECPPGLQVSPTCPVQQPCSNVCTPPPPKCGTASSCGGMVEGHDCYLVCG
jgi:hypothetical protein